METMANRQVLLNRLRRWRFKWNWEALILVAPYHADSLLLALDLQGRLVWDFVPAQ